MGTSLTHPTQSAHATEPQEQLQRLRELTSEQMTAGLIWLSGYASAVFEAVLDAVQPCAGDPAPDGNSEPGPFCGHCGSAIGIFLRFGLDWRHESLRRGGSFQTPGWCRFAYSKPRRTPAAIPTGDRCGPNVRDSQSRQPKPWHHSGR